MGVPNGPDVAPAVTTYWQTRDGTTQVLADGVSVTSEPLWWTATDDLQAMVEP